MKATESASEVLVRIPMALSIGQPVRVSHGSLAGVSGTLVGLPAARRASVRIQPDVRLHIDQSCLEPED